MALDGTGRRRLLGALALGGAVAMLIVGETVLKDQFGPVAFLGYWLGCLVLTVLAIVVALADARAAQVRIRREQKELVETTFKDLPLNGGKPGSNSGAGRSGPPGS